ncbi:MAG: hypothetical protein ABIS67_11835, partial [Candidatus Eisenbacteria bacterium]
MTPACRCSLPAVPLLAFALLISAVPAALAQCPPAACAATHAYIDFEIPPPGSPVEGLGVGHPYLNIKTVAWPFGPT